MNIDLPPDLEYRLQAEATRRGVDPSEVVRRLLSDNLLPLPILAAPEEDKTLALFAHWKAEEANLTPEQAAAEDAAWEQIMQNLQ